MVARIVFASPVPPMKTGTARYLSLFFEECGDALSAHQLLIVAPSDMGPTANAFMGIPVIRDQDYVCADDDLLIVFVANNRFHKFVFPILERRKRGTKVVSIIHDPQCFMNVESMNWTSATGFNIEGMESQIKYEMPGYKDWILSRWQAYSLPHIMKYNLMAQSKIIDSSDAIIVHSYYAALRLLLESGHGAEMPPIAVMQHPKDRSVVGVTRKTNDGKFVVGCFGWISEAKRPIPIVAGFSRFLSSLPPVDRAAVQLKFVGELAQKSLNPLHLAEAYGCKKNTVHLGHVSDEEFLQEMSSVNLMFNLRFPSCGETSGTLSLASEMGIPVAMSSYQAFKEENADFLISLAPEKETNEICEAIRSVYESWVDRGQQRTNRTERRYGLPEKFDVKQALKWALRDNEAAA